MKRRAFFGRLAAIGVALVAAPHVANALPTFPVIGPGEAGMVLSSTTAGGLQWVYPAGYPGPEFRGVLYKQYHKFAFIKLLKAKDAAAT